MNDALMLEQVQMNRATVRSESAAGMPLELDLPVQPSPPEHPLGPLVYRVWPRHPMRMRGWALLLFLGCFAVLTVAVFLKPSPSGLGTHQQLGLSPCSMIVLFGYPCPTCGMTTAFSHAVRGQIISSFRSQPAGLGLAVMTALVAALALSSAVTGRVWMLNWYRIPPGRLIIGLLFLIVAGWVFKLGSGVATGALPVVP